MFIVYILTSIEDPQKYYVGFTLDLARRFGEHNSGKAGKYSGSYRPWKVETFVTFNEEQLARKFERYLKSGSGHAFLKKQFLP